MSNKIVLIGDIVDSKKLNEADRSSLQEDLLDLIGKINKKSESIEAPMTITLGDEFQAVYASAESILADSWNILAGIYPVSARFSIGIGNIVTPINKEQSLGM
ncbi:MAG: SatD family protein, partial [Balneolaceae bacterium]